MIRRPPRSTLSSSSAASDVYKRQEEYLHKALTINTEIGDRNGEASCYRNLGMVFHSVGECAKAEEYLHKAITINTEIGDKHEEASCYITLGVVFQSVTECTKAEEYLRKAITINTEIGDRNGEATCYGNLGNVFESCLLYTSPSPRDGLLSRMPSSA